MEKLLIVISFFLLFVSARLPVYSQVGSDIDTTTAVRMVTRLISGDSLLLELRLQRLNTNWQRWANGSFIFAFNDTTHTIDSTNFALSLFSRDGLISDTVRDPNFDNYFIKTTVLPGRFSIQFRGPDTFDKALEVPYIQMDTEDSILTYTTLGTFLIWKKDTKPFIDVSSDTINTFRLVWKNPLSYYQASSYKTEVPIPQFNQDDYYKKDDNVELYQPFQSSVTKFFDDNTAKPRTILRYVDATYEGAKKISISWMTRQEAFVKGWVIYRGQAPFGSFDPNKIEYTKEVANFLNPPYDVRLSGLGTRNYGKSYMFTYDSSGIERGYNYCYELRYIDFNNNIVSIPNAKVCVNIPNSVLTFAKAYPNPLERETQVSYFLEDDAIVSVKMYDVAGKLVKIIQENVYTKMGQHVFDLEIPELATQGMYDLLIDAQPVEDKTVERSYSVIKLQVIR